jgi:hypothetical protein
MLTIMHMLQIAKAPTHIHTLEGASRPLLRVSGAVTGVVHQGNYLCGMLVKLPPTFIVHEVCRVPACHLVSAKHCTRLPPELRMSSLQRPNLLGSCLQLVRMNQKSITTRVSRRAASLHLKGWSSSSQSPS